jgi:hypothetical protein
MSDILNLIVGIFIGIATNLFSWWILFHGFSPILRFSPSVCKTSRNPTPGNKTKYVYRVKLENSGKRGIIDVELMVRLRLKGLEGYPKGLSQVVYIPLGSNGETTHRIPSISPAKKSGSRPILIFCTEVQSEFRNLNNYPKHIVNKAKGKSLLLEDVLKLSSDTFFQIIGFGYDEFSGSRKVFRSKKYTLQDIIYGNFDRDGIGVIPTVEE